MEERWFGMRARWRVQAECDLIVLGVIKLGGVRNLGKINQYIKLYYFSANLQNKIKSFDSSIDHPIAEVLLGGFCINRKIHATGPAERLHHGCVLF
jgi:hypothetical protein